MTMRSSSTTSPSAASNGSRCPPKRRRPTDRDRTMRKRQKIAAWAAAVFAVSAMPQAHGAEPVMLRQAYVAVVSNFASILLEKRELMHHYGQSYVMQPEQFRGSPAVITALASGDLQIGHLAYSTFALAVENGKMDGLRIISGE